MRRSPPDPPARGPWDPGETGLGALGEEALIQRVARLVPVLGPGVVAGIGDDAAVVTLAGRVLVTCDIQVEGIHFTRELCAPPDVGWRALAVNLSDIAAMGGRPRYAVVSLALPQGMAAETVDDLYRGLGEAARLYGVVVVGGNMSGSPGPLVVDVTLLGEADRVLGRGGARPGDRVWLSGWAGKARGGLFLLQHPEVDVPGRDRLAASYRRPEPRVALGRLLAAEPSVTALIDTSDGVATDLAHVARASGVGVWLDLDRVPRPVGLEEAARAAGQDPEAWLLGGGEDYELLFTATRDFDGIASRVAASAGVPLTPVGEVVPAGEGAWVRTSRGRVPLRPAGWDHFRRHREEGDQ
jgi:thiamine-monophosphate kinase